jgi:hypothetical protein
MLLIEAAEANAAGESSGKFPASSLLNECGKWNADAIEAQLAHVEANAVRKAHARAEYRAERVEMMAYWADRLDELRQCAPAPDISPTSLDVVPTQRMLEPGSSPSASSSSPRYSPGPRDAGKAKHFQDL